MEIREIHRDQQPTKTSPPPLVHCFIDNSNIYISAQQVACRIDGNDSMGRMRLHSRNLRDLCIAGRSPGSVMWAGSTRGATDQKMWDSLKHRFSSDTFEISERGSLTGTEQGVDQALQTKIYSAIARSTPGVIALATGDGKGSSRGDGFIPALEHAIRQGWAIEVISWEHSCHNELRHLAEDHGAFVSLDRHYEQITYLKDLRWVKKLNLTHRPRAPRPPTPRIPMPTAA